MADLRGDRWYNGIPSELMNLIHDGLKARYGSEEDMALSIPNYATLSLYLARTCGAIEKNYKITKRKRPLPFLQHYRKVEEAMGKGVVKQQGEKNAN
jgi:hypothetical protein